MNDSVLDLDILAPPKKIVVLNGNEIDLSFIPVGILFDIDEIVGRINALDFVKMQNNDISELRKAIDASISLCAVFCSVEYPEMDESWFRRKATNQQIEALAKEIRTLLTKGYQDAAKHSKKKSTRVNQVRK